MLSVETVFTAQDTDTAEQLRQRLYAFNGEHVPIVFEYINLYLKDGEGRFCGGLLAQHYWNCLYIDILWIEPEYRGLGYEVFGVLDDSPKGYSRYYMSKRLKYQD